MQITMNPERGTFSAMPITEPETVFLAALVSGDILSYKGRIGAQPRDPYSERMCLRFLINGEVFVMVAESDENEGAVRKIRDAVFLSTTSLEFLGLTDSGFEFCVARCKHCNAYLIDPPRCHWKTCRTCTDKCEHIYGERGLLLNTLSTAEFCNKCGTVQPGCEVRPLLMRNESGSIRIIA